MISDPHVIEQRRIQRVTRALANPVYFAEQYVRPFDANWVDDMPLFGQEMLAFALRNSRSVVMLPPEFMKTTLLSQVLPLWLTVTYTASDKMLRGMLLSEEEAMAKGNLSTVAWHIEHNERLAADFVDTKGQRILIPDPDEDIWRDDSIIVKRKGTSKDPTWQAKGLDSKGIHGRRLDWLIGDDVITPRNAASPAYRKTALDTYDLVLETRIVKTGTVLMAGNFNDTKDMLHTLGERKGWQMFKRPSMSKPGKPSVAPKESELAEADLLWESNWNRERLMALYESTPNRFRRIHLMDPRAEYGERLNTGWVQLINDSQIPWSYCKFYIGLDPAPGGDGNDLDFFNITVGALHNQNFDIVECFDVRASAGRQATLVGMIHDRYNRIGMGVQAIGASKVALDRYFVGVMNVVRKDLERKVEPISAPGNKEERLEATGAYFQSGWARVLESVWEHKTSNIQDRFQEIPLMEQWRDFPYANHDDKLDGIDIAIRTANEYSIIGDREYTLEVVGED